MNVSPGVETEQKGWSHANNRARRRAKNRANEEIVFPKTVSAWARSTREERDAYSSRFGTIPPELLTPREASAVIARMSARARERGLQLELTLSLEEIAREHEARERSTPWLVKPVLDPLIERLSRLELGYSNATQFSLRRMAWVDTGHVYGEESFGRRLREGHAAGELERKRVPRGGRFRNGEHTIGGTTTNRFWSERERRERLWKDRIAKRAQRKQRARAERVIQREPTAPETPARARAVDEPRTALPHVLSESILRQEFLRSPPTAEPIGVPAAADDDLEARRALAIKAAVQAAAHWTPAERGKSPKPPD